MNDKTCPPEFESIEAFAEYKFDDEQTEFSSEELAELAFWVRKSFHVVRVELESYGLQLTKRQHERNFRGFSSNPNDRWYGPGAEKMHGGSGWEQISGFAGQRG